MAAKGVLGNRLTRVCHQRQLTDGELAVRAGISRAQLNRIRNCRAVPRVGTALALAAALRTPVGEVFFLGDQFSNRRR